VCQKQLELVVAQRLWHKLSKQPLPCSACKHRIVHSIVHFIDPLHSPLLPISMSLVMIACLLLHVLTSIGHS